jgi:hypothetical protein
MSSVLVKRWDPFFFKYFNRYLRLTEFKKEKIKIGIMKEDLLKYLILRTMTKVVTRPTKKNKETKRLFR